MSASLRLKVGVLAAGLSCLLVGHAAAQQTQTPGQPRTGQLDRPATLQAQPRTAQFRGTQATTAQRQEIARYLANCLFLKNNAEVEISQFAQQQSQNPEVKQFAQQLVQDHRQLVQKLQQLPGFQAWADRVSQTPGADLSEPRRDGLNRDVNNSLAADQSTGPSGAFQELAEIDRQITERCTQMLREELQAKSGAEFDKCFLSAQIGSHAHMLAALAVIEQRAQGPLQQVAQDAQSKVQQHLDHAKQLLMQQEASGRTGAQAERQPARTQR